MNTNRWKVAWNFKKVAILTSKANFYYGIISDEKIDSLQALTSPASQSESEKSAQGFFKIEGESLRAKSEWWLAAYLKKYYVELI